MAKKSLIEALESLQKTEARQAILDYLENSIQYRKDELCGLTVADSNIGLDFETRYSIHDLWRNEIKIVTKMKDVPNKLIAMEEVRINNEREAAENGVQENIDALAELIKNSS